MKEYIDVKPTLFVLVEDATSLQPRLDAVLDKEAGHIRLYGLCDKVHMVSRSNIYNYLISSLNNCIH